MRASFDDRVRLEAGAWLARVQGGSLSPQDEMAFREWLDANPAHASAFETATNIWDRLGAIPAREYIHEEAAPKFSRRALIASAASMVAITAAGISLSGKKAEAKTFTTAVGRYQRVALSDGTNLLLDTNTQVSVEFSSDIRTVNLQYGRINCHVKPESRKFAVNAADRTVEASNSIFDLSYLENCFSVVLIKGNAIVGSNKEAVLITEGERAVAAGSEDLKRDRPLLANLTAWQSSHLVFRNDTVAEAVRQMNRYSNIKIEVPDPQIGAELISGGYDAGDNVSFAESLADLLHVSARQNGDKIELIGPTPT